MPEFKDRLRETRTRLNWSQIELSQRTGIPPALISQYESGYRNTPKADNVIKFALAMGVTTDYLLGVQSAPLNLAVISSPRKVVIDGITYTPKGSDDA